MYVYAYIRIPLSGLMHLSSLSSNFPRSFTFHTITSIKSFNMLTSASVFLAFYSAPPLFFYWLHIRPAVVYIFYILPSSLCPPPPPTPITAGCVAAVLIVIVELPPEFTRSRAAILTSTRLRLRVASPP